MRIAIFVAVVVAHIALVWYFQTLRHLAASGEDEDQSSMTLVFLAPQEPVFQPAAGRPMAHGSPPVALTTPASPPGPPALSNLTGLPQQADLTEPPRQADLTDRASAPQQVGVPGAGPASQPNTQAVAPTIPNWYDQAQIVAAADAQHSIESEDRVARQAGALTAMIKPLTGPHVPGPAFPWDPSPRYRWQPVRGGGWVMALNDHCQLGFFIMIFVGCTIGELPPARGDLFKYMHPPVKFGDWDWRLADP